MIIFRKALIPPVTCVALAWLIVACGTHRGVYHTVRPGETVSEIARAYGVPSRDVLGWNRLNDPRKLQAGQQVFVPGASEVVRVASNGPVRIPDGQGSSGGGTWNSTARPAPAAPLPSGLKLSWPLKGTVVSGYGFREGIHHDGLDIGAPEGTKVAAAADGRVLYAGDKLSGYGNLLVIRHSGAVSTIYAHNRELLVKKGDFVTAGQPIATVGQTGRASGPHLHFELRNGKKAVDPLGFLP